MSNPHEIDDVVGDFDHRWPVAGRADVGPHRGWDAGLLRHGAGWDEAAGEDKHHPGEQRGKGQ
jgi:hypothetical protein